MKSERIEYNPLPDSCREIAKIIGGNVSGERIRRVIKLSNTGGQMLHGIKRYESLERIQKEGILPLAPEGGYASYWSLGNRIFWSSVSSSGRINTYDTTFFDYGHNRGKQERSGMIIAITNGNDLQKIGPVELKEDSLVHINFPIPRAKIYLIQVNLEGRRHTSSTPRERAQALEQEMFRLIEESLVEGYKSGEGRLLTVSI